MQNYTPYEIKLVFLVNGGGGHKIWPPKSENLNSYFLRHPVYISIIVRHPVYISIIVTRQIKGQV